MISDNIGQISGPDNNGHRVVYGHDSEGVPGIQVTLYARSAVKSDIEHTQQHHDAQFLRHLAISLLEGAEVLERMQASAATKQVKAS